MWWNINACSWFETARMARSAWHQLIIFLHVIMSVQIFCVSSSMGYNQVHGWCAFFEARQSLSRRREHCMERIRYPEDRRFERKFLRACKSYSSSMF